LENLQLLEEGALLSSLMQELAKGAENRADSQYAPDKVTAVVGLRDTLKMFEQGAVQRVLLSSKNAMDMQALCLRAGRHSPSPPSSASGKAPKATSSVAASPPSLTPPAAAPLPQVDWQCMVLDDEKVFVCPNRASLAAAKAYVDKVKSPYDTVEVMPFLDWLWARSGTADRAFGLEVVDENGDGEDDNSGSPRRNDLNEEKKATARAEFTVDVISSGARETVTFEQGLGGIAGTDPFSCCVCSLSFC
jgi:hypothetical protein